MRVVFLLIVLLNSWTPLWSHSELVGTLVFAQLDECRLLITAEVDKKHLAYALKQEGACEPQDMMRICGHQYLTDNVAVGINGTATDLLQEDMTIGKDYVTYRYTIALTDPAVEKIQVTGNYLFKYNDHSILRVIFDFKGPTRSFTIKDSKRSILAKF